MNDYLKDLNGNENLEQKVGGEQTSGVPISPQTAQQQVQVKKKKHPIRNALLWTGGAIGVIGYGIYKIIWPPRFKKYAGIGLAVGMIYGCTHPATTVNAIEDGVKWTYDEVVGVIEGREEAEKIKNKANSQVQQKDLELTAQQKEMGEMQKRIKEISGQKVIFQNKYEQVVDKSGAKDKIIVDLRNHLYTQTQKNEELRERLQAKQEVPEKQTTTFIQPQQIKPHTPNTSNLEKKVDKREIKTYTSNYHSIPQSVLQLYKSNCYKKIIHVDKHNNKLSLFENSGDELKWKVTYNCSTAKNSAPKRRQGDGATPEETGVLSDEVFVKGLDPLYGVGFYRVKWKGGWQGVLLCGTNLANRIEAIEKGEDCTNSGIILRNNELLDLKRRIGTNYRNVGVVVEDSTRSLYRK